MKPQLNINKSFPKKSLGQNFIQNKDFICELNALIQSDNDTNIFEQNGGEVFYSDFNIDTIPELLIPCWEYFKANASKLIDCYNPIYDLFAGYVLVGLIKNGNESRAYSDCDDFLNIVVEEF